MNDGSSQQREATRKKAPPRPRKPACIYTAWHPLLVALLEQVLPAGFYQCLPEFQLSREPLRIDVVVVRRRRPGTPPAPHLLTSVVGDLADHTLVHFKGPTDELERDDARMLLAYALQYLVVAELADPAPIALRVIASRTTPRFLAALKSLGCPLTTTAPGTHEGRLLVFPLRVIETVPVNRRPGEHLLYAVTPGILSAPEGVEALSLEERQVFWALSEHVEQIRHPLPGQRRRHMKDENEVVESYERALTHLLERLPPERRFVGLTPEQRVAGLTEAQTLLAMPEAALRALSKEYLATLPRSARAAIEKRLAGGGAGASPPKPTRRRKPR